MSNVLIIYQKLVGWTNDGVIAMRAGMADFHVDLINSAAGTIAIGGGGKPVGRWAGRDCWPVGSSSGRQSR